VPSGLAPQLAESTTATLVNAPLGGLASPLSLLPQQTTVSSVATAQPCVLLTESALKDPAGGDEDEQASEPSEWIPQESRLDASAMTENVPERGKGTAAPLASQQPTEPSE